MSKYTLDTNIISYLLRGNSDISGKMRVVLLNGNTIIINPITRYEIYRGLLGINSRKKMRVFDEICKTFGVPDLTSQELDVAAELYVTLRKSGNIIEDSDLFIAAFCKANDIILVTNNEKHFNRVEGLRLENWSS